MDNFLGIMQGRLLPKYKGHFQAHPVGYWQNEFLIASEFGFDGIEFIFDYHMAKANPLLIKDGLDEILLLSKKNNIKVRSICADYFMSSPIFCLEHVIKKRNLQILKKLIINAHKLSITDIIIPLVDKSSIINNEEKIGNVIKFFDYFFQENEVKNVNICLETDLPAKNFLRLINCIDHPQIKINYDTGNSASLGYNFIEEFDIYGHFVTNIHIKDRVLNGSSIKLGKGNFNFEKFFKYLGNFKYNGIFILQTYRSNDAISSIIPQLSFVKNHIKEYFNIK